MSSLRQQQQSTSISVMRPPKPPSWRDFVASDVHNCSSKPPSFTTLAVASSSVENNNAPTTASHHLSCRVLETKSTTHLSHDVIDRLPRHSITSLSTAAAALASNRSTRPGRQRPRAKIHRTRSEHGILTDDIPRDSLPSVLRVATAPGARIGGGTVNDIINPSSYTSISKQPNQDTSDGCPVALEITRRCQSWLASIEACEPLDEVSYSSSTPIPSPIATAVVDNRYKQKHKNYGGFGPFPVSVPVSVHTFGEDVDVEIPDEMFVWPRERRSSSPLSQDEPLPPLTDKSRGGGGSGGNSGGGGGSGAQRDNNKSVKVTKYSITSSGSHKDAFIPIETQILPLGKSDHRVEFSTFHNNEDFNESVKKHNKKNSSKLCCDVCITFNCYRRKEVQSDT